MTLVELHVDVARVANALEKIAELLEKLVTEPPPADIQVQQSTLDDLHDTSPEQIVRIQAEQQEFAERYQVMPGSPAMMQALVDWENEQRMLYGEEWQAPNDWRSILAAIERPGQVGEPAEAASQRKTGEIVSSGAR